MKKAIDAKIKASLQLPSEIKNINFQYPKSYRPAKKNKDKANRDHENKIKSTQNLSPINIS